MLWFASPSPGYADVISSYKATANVLSESASSNTYKTLEAFIVVRPGLLRCGNNPDMPMVSPCYLTVGYRNLSIQQCLPPSQVGYTTVSRISGIVWIDKTGAMDNMDRLGAPLSLICRPSGFGKTCFAMMNLYYHSALTNPDMFRDVFGAENQVFATWSSDEFRAELAL